MPKIYGPYPDRESFLSAAERLLRLPPRDWHEAALRSLDDGPTPDDREILARAGIRWE